MATFSTTTYGQKNKKVIFIFKGLGKSALTTWYLGNIFAVHGFKAIIYTQGVATFSPDSTKTRNNITHIKDDVLRQIKMLPKSERRNISIFGTSLGTIPALIVANEVRDIKKIALSSPFASLTDLVWSWNKKQFNFRKELAEKKVTRKKLRFEWFDLEPKNNLDAFADKTLLIYASERDEIIPYSQTKEFIDILEREEIAFEAIINTRHKHITSSLLSILRYHVYITFFDKKK